LHTVLQDAWNTKLDAFSWLAKNPEKLGYFNEYMALRRGPKLSWLSVYPMREELASCDWASQASTRAIYVNIGGGIGHQCAQFKDAYPDVQGTVILQDLACNVDKALPTLGVRNMVHDFFEEQPIKGKLDTS
jgi:hypothetical protein